MGIRQQQNDYEFRSNLYITCKNSKYLFGSKFVSSKGMCGVIRRMFSFLRHADDHVDYDFSSTN